MIQSSCMETPDSSWPDDDEMAEKVAHLVDRLRRGETLDLTDDGGGHAEELRRLLPAIRVMADLADPEARDIDIVSLGDFQIVREAGRGGMGIVYEAVQVSLCRKVALKVLLNASVLDARHVQRFQIEAQVAAGLHHPGIVPVFAVGSERGIPFYAMQLIEGRNLAQVIEDCAKGVVWASSPTRDRMRAAADLGRQAAEALAHAHAHEVLHRDIKPSNLLVDGTGHLWIADFGLARIQGTLDLTRTSDQIGTPRYMSPEQAAGCRVPLDGRTDIYSLGATLYELLTLRQAFAGDERIQLLRRIAEEEPVPPRRINPGIPVDLETIVLKAMAKAPADRYVSAADLAEDLRRFLGDRSILARRPSLIQHAGKWAWRHRTLVAAVAVVGAISAVGVAVGSWQYTTWLKRSNAALQSQVERAEKAERRAQAALSAVREQRGLADGHMRATLLRRAHQEVHLGHVELARDLLDEIGAGPDGADQRDFTWHYVDRLAREDVIEFRADDRRLDDFALSPDGRLLAITGHDSWIQLWDVATRRRRADLTGTSIRASHPVFSPDGRRLVAIEEDATLAPERRRGALVWDTASGRLLARLPARREGATLTKAGFLIGHSTILLQFDHPRMGAYALWSLEPDPARPRRVGDHAVPAGSTWAPDRPLIIRVGHNLRLLDPESGKVRAVMGGATAGEIGPWAWSEDGRGVAAIFSHHRLVLWDAATGVELRRYRTDEGPFAKMRFSPAQLLFAPDGHRVAARDDMTGQIHLWNGETGRTYLVPWRLTLHVDEPGRMNIAFSRDSRYLAVSSRGTPVGASQVTLWDVDTGRRLWLLPSSPSAGEAGRVEFTPDGRQLIIGGSRAIRLRKLAPGPSIHMAGHADEAWTLAFSPDGQTLASGSDDTEDDDTIKLWNSATGGLQRGWRTGGGTVAALAFSPDGRTLASASLGRSKNLRLWDVASGRLRATLEGHSDRVRTVAYSPDGRWLASAGSDRTVRLWDARDNRWIDTLAGHTGNVRKVAFSPDSRTLASASNDRTVRLWVVGTRKVKHVFQGPANYTSIAFSPRGSLLAATDEGGTISLWDTVTGARSTTIHGDDARLFALSFSPDGRTLAAAGAGRVIRIWDCLTSQELLALPGHAAQINALAFSPDGGALASCSHDGAVDLWRADESSSR